MLIEEIKGYKIYKMYDVETYYLVKSNEVQFSQDTLEDCKKYIQMAVERQPSAFKPQ